MFAQRLTEAGELSLTCAGERHARRARFTDEPTPPAAAARACAPSKRRDDFRRARRRRSSSATARARARRCAARPPCTRAATRRADLAGRNAPGRRTGPAQRGPGRGASGPSLPTPDPVVGARASGLKTSWRRTRVVRRNLLFTAVLTYVSGSLSLYRDTITLAPRLTAEIPALSGKNPAGRSGRRAGPEGARDAAGRDGRFIYESSPAGHRKVIRSGYGVEAARHDDR